ncbi:restriction endonuclease subunit S [candidate division WOR-3 bacterium]|nr:restriction endonuclease subunit S [candidate division WOR-3 bacterium]
MELTKLSNIFDIKYGNGFELYNLKSYQKRIKNTIPFVARTANNNGISAFVEIMNDVEPFQSGLITVAVSGSVLEAFLQTERFYTGFHILVLYAKYEMSMIEKLYYCQCIKANKYKYSYGRQANKTLKDILVPKFIPQEFANIDYEKLNTLNPQSRINQDFELDTKKWLHFRIGDIFDDVSIAKSVDLLNLEKDENSVNYVGRTRENNGITARVCPSNDLIDLINKGDCITVTMVGDSTCSTFFQYSDFFASQNILVLRSKHLNQYNALFIANIIHLEKYRFSYGRTLTKSFFKNHMIKLPSKDGGPDFEFMESYIKSLPYSSSI